MAAAAADDDDDCGFRFRITVDDDELFIVESSASSTRVATAVPAAAVIEFSFVATSTCFEGDLAMVYWMIRNEKKMRYCMR